jgi:hypothetical protein
MKVKLFGLKYIEENPNIVNIKKNYSNDQLYFTLPLNWKKCDMVGILFPSISLVSKKMYEFAISTINTNCKLGIYIENIDRSWYTLENFDNSIFDYFSKILKHHWRIKIPEQKNTKLDFKYNVFIFIVNSKQDKIIFNGSLDDTLTIVEKKSLYESHISFANFHSKFFTNEEFKNLEDHISFVDYSNKNHNINWQSFNQTDDFKNNLLLCEPDKFLCFGNSNHKFHRDFESMFKSAQNYLTSDIELIVWSFAEFDNITDYYNISSPLNYIGDFDFDYISKNFIYSLSYSACKKLINNKEEKKFNIVYCNPGLFRISNYKKIEIKRKFRNVKYPIEYIEMPLSSNKLYGVNCFIISTSKDSIENIHSIVKNLKDQTYYNLDVTVINIFKEKSEELNDKSTFNFSLKNLEFKNSILHEIYKIINSKSENYALFVDPKTISSVDRIEKQMKHLINHPNLEVITCGRKNKEEKKIIFTNSYETGLYKKNLFENFVKSKFKFTIYSEEDYLNLYQNVMFGLFNDILSYKKLPNIPKNTEISYSQYKFFSTLPEILTIN